MLKVANFTLFFLYVTTEKTQAAKKIRSFTWKTQDRETFIQVKIFASCGVNNYHIFKA